jgi:hypothetical protein
MKTNYPPWPLLKLVWTLALASLIAQGWWTIAHHNRIAPCESGVTRPSVKELQKWYGEHNAEMFNNTLPKDLIIDSYYNRNKNWMAATMHMSDGSFHIQFNPVFCLAERTYDQAMVHEMCHVAVMQKNKNDDTHGDSWQACMKGLAVNGGMERVW